MRTARKNYFLSILIILLLPALAFAQTDSLRTELERIVNGAPGKIGAAVCVMESGDTLSVNGGGRYPMQSVYKFPLALAVLHQVDLGKLSLSQKIALTKKNLLPNTWSPLRKKYPNGGVKIPLSELITITVSESDNNGCDILFKLVGGTKKVNSYIHGLGVKGINIAATEAEMHKAWDVQYRNWCTPPAMAKLFYLFFNGKILSSKSQEFLMEVMTNTVTGAGRIKGLLPKGTEAAHKTGTSDTNGKGITAATNDAGIIALPNGRDVAVVVFVSDSPAKDAARDEIIAKIAKAVYDFYSVK